MKLTKLFLQALFSFSVFCISFLQTGIATSNPVITFPNGVSSIVHAGIHVTPINNLTCDVSFMNLEGNGDMNLYINATGNGLVSLVLLQMPMPNATFNVVSNVGSASGHLQWNPTPFGPGLLTFRANDDDGPTFCTIQYDFPLPVELSSFISEINGNDLTLKWTTTSESNNSRFEIESKDLSEDQWQTKGVVAGSGNSSVPVSYYFKDLNLNSGTYNYRLKQIDFNGNFEYHNLNSDVVIEVPGDFELSQNYPNPFNPITRIDFELPESGNINLTVYDNSGRNIITIAKGYRSAGYYSEIFNAYGIPSGVYFYKLEYVSGEIAKSKMMKLVVLK